MMKPRWVAAVSLAAVLAACSSGPLGVRPEVTSPSQGGEGRDEITLTFQLSDEDLTRASVRVEYDDGGGWKPATLRDPTAGWLSGSAVSGLRPVASDQPLTCSVKWDSWTDGVAMADATPVNVRIRLTPSDIDGVGEPVEIANFPVSNYYPELTIDRTTVAFTTDLLTMGIEDLQDPPFETIQITNTGPGGTTLSWISSVTYDAGNPLVGPDWILLTPTTGGAESVQLDADVDGSVTATALPAGMYLASVEIDDPAAHASPQTVTVTLVVRRQRPELSLDTTSLTFECVQGQPPAPGDQTFTVTNTGEQDTVLYWWASGYASWLTLSPSDNDASSGGGLVKNASDTVTASVDHLAPVVLPAQKYHTTVVAITGEGDDGEPVLSADGPIDVSLWVKVPPVMELSPASLSFSGGAEAYSNPVPDEQSVTLTNPGEVDLDWTASWVGAAPSWVSAVKINGAAVTLPIAVPETVLAGGVDSDTIAVTVDSMTPGLLAGDYSATIELEDQYGVTKDLVVSLHVGTRATIVPSPTSFYFVATVGGSDPAGRTLLISNSGDAPLDWTATISYTTGSGWLALDGGASASGTCTTEADPVAVSASLGALPVGTYQATINITDTEATNSPQTVSVTFDIVSGGNLVINELNPATPDRLEIYNPTLAGVNLVNWTLTYGDNSTTASYMFPSFVLGAQSYVVVQESSGSDPAVDFYTGNNILWNPSAGYCSLTNNLGVGVDFVRWGSCTVLPPGGTSWIGASAPVPSSTHTLARDRWSTDTDTAGDWDGTSGIHASAPTWGAVNDDAAPGMFTDIGAPLTGTGDGSLAWGDYDGDGDLDLVAAGRGEAFSRLAIIHRNDGGTFTDIGASLAGIWYGFVSWGDYDNDGDLDLALAGSDVSATVIAKIYRNDAGVFTDIGAALTGAWDSSLAWGDYDNDGDLDLVIAGWSGSDYVGDLYRNDAGVFVNVGAGIAAVRKCSVSWGDYDNDGDLDLVMAGYDASGSLAKVYRNDAGTFVDVGAALPGVNQCSFAWGDYDNDGDLDLAMSGYDGLSVNRIYRNDGGTFTDIGAGLLGGHLGSVAWGDYDNDGDLDLAVGGDYWDGLSWTANLIVYRNDGGGTFVDAGAGLTGLTHCSLAWGDYDNDGDLDLAAQGHDGTSYVTKVYRNDGGTFNSPPSAPTGLFAAVSGVGPYDVTFGWNAATDTQTPANGLSYNLRVGTTSGGDEVTSGMAFGSGLRKVPATGNAQKRLSWTIRGLAAGTYYWSVQAVDAAFAGSAWAGELTFDPSVPLGLFTDFGQALGSSNTDSVVLGDVDGDGDLDLVVGNWNVTNRLYLNNGTADPFSGVTGSSITADTHDTWSVALGDVDGDGDLDLVAGNSYDETNRLYLNNGTADPFAGAVGSDMTADVHDTCSVTLGDVDGDGDLDLVAGNYDATNRLYLNNGTADPFGGVTGSEISTDVLWTFSVALGDVDGDGDLDLVSGNGSSQKRLYLNNGTADPFAGVTGSDITTDAHATYSVALGDVDGDGDLDLVGASYNQPNRLYLNNGTADPFGGVTGSDMTADAGSTRSVTLGDVDGDGDLDLMAGNENQPNRLYLNNGTADPFGGVAGSDITADAHDTRSLALGDVDGDGDLDLAAGNRSTQANRVYRNDSGVANAAPSAPAGLSTSVAGAGPYDVTFSWNAATDSATPQASLTYNLRVGTSSGAADVMPGMSDAATGLREVPAMGNVQHNTSWTLTLPAGTYYWSVQAVDTAFAGSSWAFEKSFDPSAPPGELIIIENGVGPIDPDFITDIQNDGYNVTVSTTVPGSLAGYNVIMLLGVSGSSFPHTNIDPFVNAGGGCIIFEGAVHLGGLSTSANCCPVSATSGWSERVGTTVTNPASPVAVGLPANSSMNGYSTDPTLKAGADVALSWLDGAEFVVTYQYGAGKIVYVNDLWAWYNRHWIGDVPYGQALMSRILAYVDGG